MSGAARSRLGRLALVMALGAGVANIAAPIARAAQEAPIAKEKNPPGDIPDDQAFVTYKSPQGFSLQVPEGWARTDSTDGVSFADKYNEINVSLQPAKGTLTVVGVRTIQVAELEKTGRAVKVSGVTDAKLASGAAVKIAYTANSAPNPVTSKQIRLECERFLIVHGDRQAQVTFCAPAGADNVDQWVLMSNSFAWQWHEHS